MPPNRTRRTWALDVVNGVVYIEEDPLRPSRRIMNFSTISNGATNVLDEYAKVVELRFWDLREVKRYEFLTPADWSEKLLLCMVVRNLERQSHVYGVSDRVLLVRAVSNKFT